MMIDHGLDRRGFYPAFFPSAANFAPACHAQSRIASDRLFARPLANLPRRGRARCCDLAAAVGQLFAGLAIHEHAGRVRRDHEAMPSECDFARKTNARWLDTRGNSPMNP